MTKNKPLEMTISFGGKSVECTTDDLKRLTRSIKREPIKNGFMPRSHKQRKVIKELWELREAKSKDKP